VVLHNIQIIIFKWFLCFFFIAAQANADDQAESNDELPTESELELNLANIIEELSILCAQNQHVKRLCFDVSTISEQVSE